MNREGSDEKPPAKGGKRKSKSKGEKLVTELISYGRRQMKEKNIRITGGDMIRLAQICEENKNDALSTVEVKWVETLAVDDADKI